MLNLFPIQWLALIAYFILRVFVGFILIFLARRQMLSFSELVSTTRLPIIPNQKIGIVMLIGTELLLGVLFVTGTLTQAAAIGLFIFCIKMLIFRHHFSHPSIPQPLTYILLLGCALSLFITGAGAFAFDLPI